MKNKQVNKILVAALTMSMAMQPLALAIPVNVLADPVIAEEELMAEATAYGSLDWTIADVDTVKTFTITGSGSMEDFANMEARPWNGQRAGVKAIVIGNGVTNVANYAFESFADATKVTFTAESKATRIGKNAFKACINLSEITIPKSVKTIETDAFWGCNSITEFKVDSENTNYKAVDGVLFTKDGKELVKYPNGKTGDTYEVPDGVEKIHPNAFRSDGSSSAGLENITFPDSLEEIGEGAFTGTAFLDSLANSAEDGVAVVNGIVVDASDATGDVVLGKDIKKIAKDAFKMSNADSVTIKNPECVIADSENTIPDTIDIIGQKNSTADEYATANGNNFSSNGQGTYYKEVSITAGKPEAGTPVNAYALTVEGFEVDSIAVTPADEVFKEQTTYEVVATLSPSDNNSVSSTATAKVNGSSATISQADGKVNITFTADKTDAATVEATYKVKHLIQGTDLVSFTEKETDNLTAMAGKSVTVTPKEYTGFTAAEAETAIIKKDNSTVISQKYTRNSYTITYQTNGGSMDNNPAKYVYGVKEITLNPAYKDGSTFEGWYTDSAFTSAVVTKILATDTGNKTLYAKFTESEQKEDKSVKIIHKFTSTTPFTVEGKTATYLEVTKTKIGKDGDSEQAEILSDYVNQFKGLGYTVAIPAVKTFTYGKDTTVEYEYKMTHADDSKYSGGNGNGNGGNGNGGGSSSQTTYNQYGLTDSQIADIIKALDKGSSANITIDGVTYKLSKNPDGTITISMVDMGNVEKVTIPNEVTLGDKVYPVTDVADNAFRGNTKIKEAVIGNNVTSIGDSAFEDCVNLGKVTLGEKIVRIGDKAFKNTAITYLKTPATLQSIGKSAFENCTKLKTVILNEGLLKIGSKAFYNTAITSITIPASVIQIESYVFANCKKLKKVKFELDSKLLKMGTGVFMNDKALLTIKLPGRLTNIPPKAFYGCKKLSKVTGGAAVTKIGDQAFMNCAAIKSFKVNKKVQTIGKKAFYNCKKLKKVTVKSNALTKVGSKAFKKTNKKIKFVIPKAKKDAYQKLFKGKY